MRANVETREAPRPKDGMIFTGTLEQIAEDIEGCKRIGADEILFDPTFSPDAQQRNGAEPEADLAVYRLLHCLTR